MPSQPLNKSTVKSLPEDVRRSTYDRSDLSVGIVHFGVGGFHRAHQAVYLDSLMNRGEAHEWGLCGIGVLPQDQAMADALQQQDMLYTVMIKHPDGSREARVIGSIVDYLFAPDDPEKVIELLAAPTTRIVSLTITEGGYSIDPVTGEFDPSSNDLKADIANPDGAPTSAFGLIIAGLRRRRDAGLPPFTIQSCDNIQGNGSIAQASMSSFADLIEPGLGAWIREKVAFPNSMVDRITPVTTDDDRRKLAEDYGIDDRWPVVCEPFTQWVIEDHFPAGRPRWEDVGAQLVPDVMPYELMKLRLLNASHQGMCYFGYLAGYRYAHEAVANPEIRELLRRYMDTEATPTLQPVPGVDLDAYKRELIERFSNPAIRDTLARLCAESSDRIPKWLLPVAVECLKQGITPTFAAAICASWARYDEAIDEESQPINVVDRLAETLVPLAQSQTRDDDLAFIKNEMLFGSLADEATFTNSYRQTLRDLHAHGSKKTLKLVLDRSSADRC